MPAKKKIISQNPRISIIIPVLHEQSTIQTILQHLQNLPDSPSFEIIIVDGSKDQDTIATITDPFIITCPSKKGRATQMNTGANFAQGEVLLFLHADTFLPKNALQLISETLKYSTYVGGAFRLHIHSKKFVFKLISAFTTMRSRITRIPYGDQAIFLRASFFNQIGKYANIPILEDVELMKRIRKAGENICILPYPVVTSARRWEQQGILSTTFCNFMISLLYRCNVSPHKLQKWHQ